MPSADPAVAALLARAAEAARSHPLCAVQVAVARGGTLTAFETFGRAAFAGGAGCPDGREAAADNRTLFSIYSVTKAVVAAASWLLLQERTMALADRVVEYVPEFGSHGKEAVTIEQLLTHTAGFPSAQFPPCDWPEPARRMRRFAGWRLEWAPGSRFVYHPTATMWALAEVVTRVSGMDYRDFVRTRIVEPLGLESPYIGLPTREHARVADVVCVGEVMAAGARATSPVDAPVVGDDLRDHANSSENRVIGGPGGGAIATAGDVALLYQAFLADAAVAGPGIWRPDALRDAWTVRNPTYVDPMTGQPALRGLGVVLAGVDGRVWRGFSETCSPAAFGHMGAGGQVSWADPATGLSFVLLTNGAHRDPVHQGATSLQLSTLAAACTRSQVQ